MLLETLLNLGIKKGDAVYLGIDMGRLKYPFNAVEYIGKYGVKGYRDECCNYIFSKISSIVGKTGSILVPTFTYSYARSGVPYSSINSPSELGPFTEYFRKKHSTYRTEHPLFSVACWGNTIFYSNESLSAFGPTSIFAKLNRVNTKFLNLGIPLYQTLTYAHYLEQLIGVGHMYHKFFDISDGIKDKKKFSAYVRYLNAGVEYDLKKIQDQLVINKSLKEYILNDIGHIQVVDVEDVYKTGIKMLEQNPSAFLVNPIIADIENHTINFKK